ncbi:amidase [Ramlibacter sp. PS4R-6]|uniref:amidase n=1 Tax=Ramlibacter sp. PS4R-6 TaxID=3133438 RepID=UPI00309A3B58
MQEITDRGATALSRSIHSKEVSCREVMQAFLARIAQLNPSFNAIVNLAPQDTLLAQADAYDKELAGGASRGWLHGIPVAIKDAADAVGFPTTKGCELLANNKPVRDSVMAARMKDAGCIVIGKTTTPELGLGSHTFSTLWGATHNAWDTHVSAGGSSGGAAVCLAQRMLPIADGSDFMGSLRNPAGWNHCYGFRPTQGRVPQAFNNDVWIDMLSTEGPMARNVEDLGRLLLTQSGYDPRAPLSLQSAIEWRYEPDVSVLKGLRIGWLADLDGHLATDDGVLDVCEDALKHFTSAGAVVEEIPLGFDPAKVWDSWLAWRRAVAGPRVGALMHLPGAREKIKPEAQWEYECSQGMKFPEFRRATETRSAFYKHVAGLFDKWDVLVLPTAQVWPFDVSMRWPNEIAGRHMDTYHRWMEVTTYATLVGIPSLAVPAGFHANGKWPMGIQLMARHSADAFLLRVAAAYEQVRRDFIALRPPQP